MNKLKPKFKLWLTGKDIEGVFGDGKWRLLKSIERGGSLKSATESLGISYRKAWGDLKKAEQRLEMELVEKHRGGNAGGSSGLTIEGENWVKAYTQFHSDVEKAVEKAYKKHIRHIVK